MYYSTALSHDSNMSTHLSVHSFSQILGQQDVILHHRYQSSRTNTGSQVMYKTKLRLRTVDSLLTSQHIYLNLEKSQGLCYLVLEFSITPTRLILKAKLDTLDKKKNEQVTHWVIFSASTSCSSQNSGNTPLGPQLLHFLQILFLSLNVFLNLELRKFPNFFLISH